ncbi:uncharacterized protein BT62DRAFT_927307 [Guyanagaster necrorhizus]|uniref:Uncharacterized protein n=1 Tax=Guyanagaster necrorhizus TaxID=856835 RepID=A0A9P7W372_9AGAR|nr:uncharacterized protein BT62DRAFT_927307 [Guyanagaster necrorhizus MCA 3950]KAG7451585.1 hypothetical protein BT62DRAFT_927307 [Guyanagaster necrorhizus MCA 3950]
MRNKALQFGPKNIAFGAAIAVGLTGTVYWLGYREMEERHTGKTVLPKSEPENQKPRSS